MLEAPPGLKGELYHIDQPDCPWGTTHFKAWMSRTFELKLRDSLLEPDRTVVEVMVAELYRPEGSAKNSLRLV